jgi:NAD(P)-dependent dehydrogenase (short-subunit alcohol dehydrogenase family)
MMQRMKFAGKTAVITGAASGIGRALSAALASHGCHLALADINEVALRAVANDLTQPGLRVSANALDVGDAGAIAEFAQTVEAEHGGAHLLFNNAGVALGGAFEDITPDDFEWLFDINFRGVVRMTRAFLPLLRGADMAHIINISSLFGLIAPAGQTAYCASKFAVRGFSDSLRHELAGSSIGVTTVHPGGVNTQIAMNARTSAKVSNEERDRGIAHSQRLLVMPPPKAASIIVRAVTMRKPRVLVGRDAHITALIERLMPSNYWSIIGRKIQMGAQD